MEEKTLLEILLDEYDKQNIFLTNSKGEQVEFIQVAVIPYQNEIFCILKPVLQVYGIGENEAILFKMVEDEKLNDVSLCTETDELVVKRVFKKYRSLLGK